MYTVYVTYNFVVTLEIRFSILPKQTFHLVLLFHLIIGNSRCCDAPNLAGLRIRIRIRIRSYPDLFGRIRIRSRIRKIFTGSGSVSGSGSYRYFSNVKLYKQGQNILKIEVSHIFRWIFPFFHQKIIIIEISKEICLMWTKI